MSREKRNRLDAEADWSKIELLGGLVHHLINKILPTLAGGVSDVLGLLPVAQLIGPENSLGGSAVLVGDKWALTASHCIASKPRKLYLWQYHHPETTGGAVGTKKATPVKAVHWQDGHITTMEKPTTWPEYAPTLTSGRDEIVLLELANPIKPLVGLDFAKPAGDALPKLGELLLTSGFGEDDDGNCPKGAPPLAVMRYFGERRDGRGSGYRDPRILWNGIARKFDSGAPVFFPDISTFDPIVRLIGIHSCRTAAGDNDVIPATEEVAEFLRITPLMERWIASKIRTIVSGDNSSTSSTTTTSSFVLREAFNCVLLESDDALVNKAGCEWCLEDVFSTRGFLQPCDALIISYDASTKQRSMTIVRNKKTVLGPLPLSLDGIAPDNNHWLYAAQKDVAGHLIAEYYVFQRTNSADNKTCRVRVEVFAVDGVSTKPGVKNIRTGDAAPEMSEDYTGCVSVAADSGVALADTDPGDQDDQGNGYERKRQS